MGKKINREDLKWLKDTAASLPAVANGYITRPATLEEYRAYLDDLEKKAKTPKEKNQIQETLIEFEALESAGKLQNKTFTLPTGEPHLINHLRRMKKIFNEHHYEGVKMYIDEVTKWVLDKKKSSTEGDTK